MPRNKFNAEDRNWIAKAKEKLGCHSKATATNLPQTENIVISESLYTCQQKKPKNKIRDLFKVKLFTIRSETKTQWS